MNSSLTSPHLYVVETTSAIAFMLVSRVTSGMTSVLVSSSLKQHAGDSEIQRSWSGIIRGQCVGTAADFSRMCSHASGGT
jgi:hypothetical protein